MDVSYVGVGMCATVFWLYSDSDMGIKFYTMVWLNKLKLTTMSSSSNWLSHSSLKFELHLWLEKEIKSRREIISSLKFHPHILDHKKKNTKKFNEQSRTENQILYLNCWLLVLVMSQ